MNAPTFGPHVGPRTAIADQLHATKYRSIGEDYREASNRVAFALKDSDPHYHEFREVLKYMRFLPGGRIQSAMGAAGRRVTAYNCFVSGDIADSYVDKGGIMPRAVEAAATMRMGGGIGYDFSKLRPRGFRVAGIDSQASGPVSFMPIYDSVCLATASYGHRRGAQMGVLRVDHPDIEEFIGAKQNSSSLKGFNVSIAMTDAFMEAVSLQRTFKLRFGSFEKEVDAAFLWEKIMRSTWDWAEPGVLFIDTINRMNNLYYCEEIAATNPCGEQPLPPFGACLLGSFNLTAYLSPYSTLSLEGLQKYSFDFEQLKADIPCVVRAMDNVIDRTVYPLPEQKAEALNKRRMGLGVAGLANAGEALGHPYGSAPFLAFEEKVLQIIKEECYRASVELAKEKGPFTLFDTERYLEGRFVLTLPDDVKDGIRRFGIRNSHLTSIAPTGTISMCADNISSGVEPVFSYKTERPMNTPDGQVIRVAEDFGYGFLGVQGKLAPAVTAQEHVGVLVTAQRQVDSAVSKTCNVDGSMPWDEFKALYQNVWEGGGKGCTTFNKDGKRSALLVEKPAEDMSCRVDPETGARSCE